jgi:hypothetical protein
MKFWTGLALIILTFFTVAFDALSKNLTAGQLAFSVIVYFACLIMGVVNVKGSVRRNEKNQ